MAEEKMCVRNCIDPEALASAGWEVLDGQVYGWKVWGVSLGGNIVNAIRGGRVARFSRVSPRIADHGAYTDAPYGWHFYREEEHAHMHRRGQPRGRICVRRVRCLVADVLAANHAILACRQFRIVGRPLPFLPK